MPAAPTIRIALVGLGRMGKNHLRVLRETPGYEVAAIVDATAALPADLGDVPFLRSVSELSAIELDAAVIATPTVTHHEVALQLIAMGKHLLIEKPLASTHGGGREVLAAALAKNVKLAVGHVERFNPAVRKLREIIKEGRLGTPIHFSFTRVGGQPPAVVRGNNVILDLAVHDIDILRSLVGTVRLEHSTCHVTWQEGVFDTAEIFLAGGTGASATVHVNWITPTKIRTIRVTGTRGVCFVDYMLQTCELFGGTTPSPLEASATSFEDLQELYRTTDRTRYGIVREEPLRVQAAQFRRFLVDGEVGDLCTGSDALAAVLIAERAVEIGRGRRRPSTASATHVPPAPSDEWI